MNPETENAPVWDYQSAPADVEAASEDWAPDLGHDAAFAAADSDEGACAGMMMEG